MMKKFSTLLLLGLVSLNLSAQKMSKDKKAVVASVEKHKENLIQVPTKLEELRNYESKSFISCY